MDSGYGRAGVSQKRAGAYTGQKILDSSITFSGFLWHIATAAYYNVSGYNGLNYTEIFLKQPAKQRAV